jgi:hypothetical protein
MDFSFVKVLAIAYHFMQVAKVQKKLKAHHLNSLFSISNIHRFRSSPPP